MKKHSSQHSETKAVRGATEPGQEKWSAVHSDLSDFHFRSHGQRRAITDYRQRPLLYAYGNPTNTVAEKTVAALEGVDAALTFSSGMGAITTTLMALLKNGDHVVAQRDIYGGVNKFLAQWLPKMGIETTFVDTTEYEQHARAIRPNTKLLYLESPTNPTLRVVDFKKSGGTGEAE